MRRARIARELHEIVAHFVSVIVVQASAGQRLPDTDRRGAAEALDSIAEAAMQAQTEIARLAGLLGGEPQLDGPPRLQAAAELARRAGATGPAVNCRFLGACDRLAPAASEAGYRVVQEALTNAIKHAPGAPVHVCIRDVDGGVQVDIVNEAPQEQPSGLERSGARHGLAAMRQRIAACGGRLTAGPTDSGGWSVSALLPTEPPTANSDAKTRPDERLTATPFAR